MKLGEAPRRKRVGRRLLGWRSVPGPARDPLQGVRVRALAGMPSPAYWIGLDYKGPTPLDDGTILEPLETALLAVGVFGTLGTLGAFAAFVAGSAGTGSATVGGAVEFMGAHGAQAWGRGWTGWVGRGGRGAGGCARA
ncbi:hypothetical protein PF008_g24075 [Phytophthora fragariae]|uniref:Uncharacterized protein n=1 Tax=Phytophthora fragariae TaxID=53985 RepID=A0A6G0QNX6_9STRA|nr:hypothetical protein PF008_g24075 [Phytophthora fragariae]